jgi:hypothetical protein
MRGLYCVCKRLHQGLGHRPAPFKRSFSYVMEQHVRGGLAVAAVFVGLLLGAGTAHADPQNTGCSSGGGVANCTSGVPDGGIKYGVPDVSDLTVSGGSEANSSNSITVDNGVIGIELSGTGGAAVTDGADSSATQYSEVTVKLNSSGVIDSGGDDTTVLAVVTSSGGTTTTTYVTVGGASSDGSVGPLVEVQGSGSGKTFLNSASGATLSDTQLDTIFASDLAGATGGGSGDAGTGIVLNNSSFVRTRNATGIVAQSNGQNGGKGGVFNIGVYAKGKRGGDGKKGGDVDVTNSGAIEVTGSSEEKYGILAKSQGGSGGRGGGAGALAARAGEGGNGAQGGTVSVTLNQGSAIKTTNDGGIGVFATSEGGRGGAGGNAGGLYAEGDDGGDGGSGGDVTVVKNGSDKIETSGDRAHGVYALSVGGGAGTGGSAGGLFSYGATGGAATTGGTVSVSINNGSVETSGEAANAVYAQSIGGGGGDGGSGGGFFASVGGDGGDGGDAGNVTVDLGALATLSTKRNSSSGIVAQAVGGGGGDGGDTTSVGAIVAVAIGGGGATGGKGGEVDVDALGDITTSGTDSNGIFAQSVGGRGGRGGSANAIAIDPGVGASFSLALAGAGGAGNIGRKVDVLTGENTDIATDGDRGVGIFAQSVGGGGGQGGNSVGVAVGVAYSGAVSLGGDGGLGGNGGIVNVETLGGSITTGTASSGRDISSWGATGQTEYSRVLSSIDPSTGDLGGSTDKYLLARNGELVKVAGHYVEVSAVGDSAVFTSVDPNASGDLDDDVVASIYSSHGAHGILAQSVGGGGGSGGTSVAAALAPTGSLSVGLGGGGTGGGDGSAVDVNNNAAITTHGTGSYGILAQSVGGGGGDGGTAVAGSVSAGLSVGVSVGGSGDAGGKGGTVDVDNYGDIVTNGDTSYGIVAQSIGGGGGSGGNAISGSIGQGAVSVALGGSAGGGGTADAVTLQNFGANVTTRGEVANALVAQSMGGGGGTGGTAVAGSIGAGLVGAGVSVGIGGHGGEGGDAGTVVLENIGNSSTGEGAGKITTSGSSSTGILAQSIGGGGGAGGTAVAAAVSVSKDGGAAISVGVGGLGAGGGTGNTVEVNNDGEIETAGADSYGILAQSLGGAGGAGGTSVGASLSASGSSSAAVGVSLGGEGGLGGTADTVEVTNTNLITTLGARSSGIAAQSIGGNGGAGGLAVAGTLNASRGSGAAISVGLGGGGGNGAKSGAVTVSNSGDIATEGEDAFGIVAQSIGGDGGTGGLSVAAAVGASAESSGAIGVSLGGSGGTGAESDKVTVGNSGIIWTQGDRAAGLVAQSLGGGGGAGGASIAGTLNISKSSGASIGVSLGGSGGAGGTAALRDSNGDLQLDLDVVEVTNTGSIVTEGADAAGILAQAIGGQGGLGGLSVAGSLNLSQDTGGSVSVSIGGEGGDAGAAGSVSVTNSSTVASDGSIVPVVIMTSGSRSGGVVAQSIAGKGGTGGLAVAASVAASKDKTGAVSVGVGGGGGTGGEAGNVSVVNEGTGVIITSGESRDATTGEAINTDAHGILAQSIGGDGGQGGIGAAGTFAVAAQQTVAIGVGIGGAGGTGGKGGEVLVDNDYAIDTRGYASMGVVAQSIGGGGGAGGGAISLGFGGSQQNSGGQIGVAVGGGGGSGGEASLVTVLQNGDIYTEGDSAHAILAQSIGGYGGQGGFSVSAGGTYSGGSDKFSGSVNVAVGGSGGDGGKAGNVIVGSDIEALTGTYYTAGENAAGLVVQSIGGSGGAGGFAGSLSTVVTTDKAKTTAIGVSVGGFGGSGGTAGTVGVNTDSDIFTEGAFSYGVLAQSIGGKGGQGGGSISGALNITTSAQGNSSVNTSVAVGGFGGNGGVADDVTVTNSGNIMTGIRAATVVLDYGDDGVDGLTIIDPVSGEEVLITGEHLVKDTGLFAHGIVAQAISGDGGAGGFAGSILFTRGTSDQKVSNYNASVSVGGLGGNGANNDAVVTVTNEDGAVIMTQGERAVGILAQVIGGSGGTGGDSGLGEDFWGEEFIGDTAVEKAINGDTSEIELGAGGSLAGASGANSNSLSVAIGGVGGKGGSARKVVDLGTNLLDPRDDTVEASVIVTNDGEIYTVGTKSHGIQAQAIGGGGGSGGLSTAASAAVQASKSRSISLAVGGVGQEGGEGGRVDVINNGRILTLGDGAAAIYAQSVGGGGGSGGDTTGFTLQRKDTSIESEDKEKNKLKSGFQLTAVVGGMAGNGGFAEAVNVTNTGELETFGTLAYGVFAQSIGGGGGDGGNASVSSKEIGAFLENDKTEKKQFLSQKYKVAVGGWGGSGGFGGDVTVNNEGDVVTHGEQAVAIYAQSVGGGGGVGGKASTGLSGDFQLGGFGGDGNDGGTVIVNNTGTVSTDDILAHGIFAQSVGGGGGDGGASSFGSARSFRGDWFKAVRQKGASGGTSKFFKEKLLAPTYGIGVGGFGGSAGDGGDVIVCNGSTWNSTTKACEVDPNVDPDTAADLAQISTVGTSAHGIFAQSVGGGGGVGGSTTLTNVGKIGIGGLGGAAGDGGDVFVQNDGAISTQGEGAYGIFAQSVGGGGGLAGDITFGIEGFGEDASKIARGIDKLADNAASASPVDLDDNGVISDSEQLYSDLVNGVEVDPSRLGVTSFADLTDADLDFNGDGEGDIALDALQEVAGKISVTEEFDLDRNGLPISDELKAAFAGLYNAGMSGGDPAAAGDSALGFTGVDDYLGLTGESTQELAQDALSTLLGDILNLPTDSVLNGLAVAWDPNATSFADADKSLIFGGVFEGQVNGGGIENLTGEQILEIVQQLNSAEVDQDGFAQIELAIDNTTTKTFSIPLLNGANGDGGDVTVIHNGDIYVAGGVSDDLEERAGSIGIFAQSVGGGGGIVAETMEIHESSMLVNPDAEPGDPDYQLTGVDINGDGDTTDTFEFSGGVSFAGSIGGQGDGGDVTVIHNGNIVAPAWNGYAIFAQSVGGNGGGRVHVELNGVIVAGLGDDDNTASTILIDGGSVGDTDYNNDGVIDEQDDNQVILGSDTFLFGLGDRVISGTFGNDHFTLESGGEVIGNINLLQASRGTELSDYTDYNSFTVEAGAVLRTRELINLGDLNPNTLGDGGLLSVAGTIIVGGEVDVTDAQIVEWIENNPLGLTPLQAAAALDGSSFYVLQNQVQTTAVTGRFEMVDTTPADATLPELVVDVRFGVDTDQSDLITTTDQATVAGQVTPTLLSLSKITPPVTIVDPTDGAGAAANNGAVARDTVVIDYSVAIDGVDRDGEVFLDGTQTIDLLIKDVDFSIDGMTRNQTAVGDHINRILKGDGVDTTAENLLTQLLALIGNKEDREDVIRLMDRLTTEGYAASRVDTLFSGLAFADVMVDCERLTDARFNPEEGQCMWAEVSGRFLSKDQSFEFKEVASDSFRFSTGAKLPIGANWRLGFAGGYEQTDLGVGPRFASEGDRGHAGLEIENSSGGLTFGAALTASHGWHETDRAIDIEEYVATQDSKLVSIGTASVNDQITQANFRLVAAYESIVASSGSTSWYLKPSVHFDASYVYSHDATESGAGPVGVSLHDTGEWIFSASPMMEVGGQFVFANGTGLRPYLRGGVTVFSDDELSIKSAFIGAPASAGTFSNWSNFDQVIGQLSAGVTIFNESDVDFTVGYEGMIGETIEQHSAKARIVIDLN